VSAVAAEARRTPAEELRTSLGLAALTAALMHLMGALHGAGILSSFAPAAIEAGLAALLAFSASRAVLGPALAFNAVLTLGGGTPWLLAAPAQLVVAAGAFALLREAGDGACVWLARLAFATLAIGAMTGFGHLGH
jgi:hypothetical protein